jgi:membrane protease YdiL (CAAX protease family)
VIRRFLLQVKLEVGDFLAGLKLVPTVVFVVAGLCLWAWHYYGRDDFFNAHIARLLQQHHVGVFDVALARCCFWSATAIPLFVIVPHLSLRTATRFSPDDRVPTVGWGLGDWRIGVSACAIFYGVMLVLLAFVANTPDFQAHYPLCSEANHTTAHFLVYEMFYAGFFISWEYFFRGFMTFGLEKTLGFWTVFAQMLPFVVMHFDKPSLEAMSSVFGGIALGYLALRTRSFWYGAFIHAATAVTLDVISVTLKHFQGH